VRLWADEEWRAGALAWARDELERLGRPIAGAPDQFHVRPWSTIFRIPTADGVVYFKAVPRQLSHEVRLTAWLARQFPDRVLPVLAADDRRGFMLFPDGGVRLRDAGAGLGAWCQVVAGYAELQLLVAPRLSELLALGVPDRRLRLLPKALAAMMPGQREELLARYAALCDELAAIGLPDTLQMDDFHDGNVFLDRERLRVFDWGDASVAHPFFSLRMILETAAKRLAVSPDGLEIRRVRDTYLERFNGFAAISDLRTAAVLAHRIVPTVRMLAWQLAYAEADHPDQWGETLEDLLEQQRSALV